LANIKRANTSGVTKSGVAIADVPDTPTIGSATAGIESATVTYTAATTGGTGSTFTATSTPGSVTGTGSSPITVAGLTADTSYTFTVRASNSTGNSPFSAASNSVTALSKLAFESIATYTVGSGGSSSISFTSIPSTYTHLQIRFIAQSNYTYPVDDAYIRFNSDTGSNYASHSLQGNGSAASAGSATSTTSEQIAYGTVGTTSGNQTTASWGAFVVDILDYSNTNKYKTTRTISGNDCNGTGNASLGGRVGLTSGLWQSTAAVTNIEIICALGARNFQEYSHFALYGIKG
jgi:large repetitive protein